MNFDYFEKIIKNVSSLRCFRFYFLKNEALTTQKKNTTATWYCCFSSSKLVYTGTVYLYRILVYRMVYIPYSSST